MNITTKIANIFWGVRFNLQFDNWPMAILSRLLFRREHLVVYRKKGVTFLVDFLGGDQGGTRSCMTTDMYTRYFPNLPRERPLTVLDLGANGGGFPLSLLAEGYALKKCVAVEMNPNTYIRLHFNLGYNCRDASRALNGAVAAQSGWAEIEDNQGNTGGSLYSPLKGPDKKRVKVPLMTFDEVVGTHFGDEMIDVCKMDIERAEYDVFFSETGRRIKQVRFLIIEIHPHPDNLDIIKKINSCGFAEVEDKIGDNRWVHLFRNTQPGI